MSHEISANTAIGIVIPRYISKKNREKDILKFVEVLIKNTSSSQQPSGDDFWVKAEKLLYTAYIGEELKALSGRQEKKYRKEHGGDIAEYHETCKQVLELYPSGDIPKVENLEKYIKALQEKMRQKDAEYRQADKKSRELSEATRTIEEYLRHEQSRDQQQKRKRNGLE